MELVDVLDCNFVAISRGDALKSHRPQSQHHQYLSAFELNNDKGEHPQRCTGHASRQQEEQLMPRAAASCIHIDPVR